MILAAAALFMTSCSCGRNGKDQAETELNDSTKTAVEMEKKRLEEPVFDIVTTHGNMRVKLYSKTPKHRDNFAMQRFLDARRLLFRLRLRLVARGRSPVSVRTAPTQSWSARSIMTGSVFIV